jgi:hypothetical protein
MSWRGAFSTSQAQGTPCSGYDNINNGIVVTSRHSCMSENIPEYSSGTAAGMMKGAAL